MFVKSLSQLTIAIIAVANFWIVKSPSLNQVVTHYQTHVNESSLATHAVKLVPLSYQPQASRPTAQVIASQDGANGLYDMNSALFLSNRNSKSRLPIASLTKITTALVILHHHDPNEVMLVPTIPTQASDVTSLGVRAGQSYRVGDLVTAMLVGSEADVAAALAIWDSGSIDKFVIKMNHFGVTWQLHDTHYAGVVGLDDAQNYSTVEDLVRLSQIALENPVFATAVSKPIFSLVSQAGTRYNVVTTNQLLGQNNIYGVKTGTTTQAGECFVGYYNDGSKQLISVVLHSGLDRFVETMNLFNYGKSQFNWI